MNTNKNSYLNQGALKKCDRENRKSINADDLIWALGQSEFSHYTDVVRSYTQKYRTIEATTKLRKREEGRVAEGGTHKHTNLVQMTPLSTLATSCTAVPKSKRGSGEDIICPCHNILDRVLSVLPSYACSCT